MRTLDSEILRSVCEKKSVYSEMEFSMLIAKPGYDNQYGKSRVYYLMVVGRFVASKA